MSEMKVDSTSIKQEPLTPGMVTVIQCSNGLSNGSFRTLNLDTTSPIFVTKHTPTTQCSKEVANGKVKTIHFEAAKFGCHANSDSPGSDDQNFAFSGSPTQPAALPTSTIFSDSEDPVNGESVNKKVCLVCGDIASGYHYGVASCEACKAFFKRTIQGNIIYTCPASGTCEITKRRRKACQACRFRKCLEMGMLKEGVRLDRVRGGRQKYHSGGKRPADSPPIAQIYVKKPLLAENELLSALAEIEPEKVLATPESDTPLSDVTLMATLSDLADRELVVTIGWAKQIPGFFQLSLADQMNLLQCSWIELLCFNASFRSCPYNGTYVFAEDFQLTQDEFNMCNIPLPAGKLDKFCRRLAQKLTNIGMTRDEYLLLKAMIIFNTDATVEDKESVQIWQDRYHDALIEYCKTYHPGNPRRLGHLLMCLPLLTQIKYYGKLYWQFVKDDGRVPLHKLFLEMLDTE